MNRDNIIFWTIIITIAILGVYLGVKQKERCNSDPTSCPVQQDPTNEDMWMFLQTQQLLNSQQLMNK